MFEVMQMVKEKNKNKVDPREEESS